MTVRVSTLLLAFVCLGQLKPAQVNLLVHLSSWSLTNPEARKTIEAALGPALRH